MQIIIRKRGNKMNKTRVEPEIANIPKLTSNKKPTM
ncbi:hypothetical protein ZPR_2646 [Zunongwangia profunda SM-A87]|uniref:Uncharacterized protein n=1 Tax=Zunongwangia profunda (strain DSM 18752 / CCTCC AB 206139 / SM-A87) TaxID=655815 RepID=D5BF70_ZUNPS|nr:hypothetical protein ZPR_2646 [Zunongwangia profunda SM-A87]